MSDWADVRCLTASVLPVRVACDLDCPFCFSKSSLSRLDLDRIDWATYDVDRYYAFARSRGATRAVITGGGEPLLRPEAVVRLVARAAAHFDEVACFTNGSRLTPTLAARLRDAGLSYLCWSRHAVDDAENRALMGAGAPDAAQVVAAAGDLPIRATCVLTRGGVADRADAQRYLDHFARLGVRQFTFKHTYVAWPRSVFGDADQNRWAAAHRVATDPFAHEGVEVGRLPWGPVIRQLGACTVCYYHEPDPDWEKEHRLCRSLNLMSDGTVFASLEDRSSRLSLPSS